MAKAKGTLAGAAIRLGATWDTAVVCGPNNGLLILPPSLKKDRALDADDSLGLYFPQDADLKEIIASLGLPAYMRYDSLDLLFALAMGASAAPVYTTPTLSSTATAGGASTLTDSTKTRTLNQDAGKYIKITGGTGAGQTRLIASNTATAGTVWTVAAAWATQPSTDSTYEISGSIASHVYTLANTLDGLFATLCIYNGVFVNEATSVKVTGFTLKGEVGKPLEVSFDVIASDIITGSAVNTTVTFATVTNRETRNRVLYDQGVIRMNAQAGDALATGDKIYPASFELSYKTKQRGDYGISGTFDKICEPTEDGPPEATLKLAFPSMTAATFLTDRDSKNMKKLDMVFTGSLLAGSSYRSLTVEIPNAVIQNVDNAVDRGIIKQPVDFLLLGCASAPTGMTSLTTPFRITLVNGYGGNPLQAGND